MKNLGVRAVDALPVGVTLPPEVPWQNGMPPGGKQKRIEAAQNLGWPNIPCPGIVPDDGGEQWVGLETDGQASGLKKPLQNIGFQFDAGTHPYGLKVRLVPVRRSQKNLLRPHPLPL